MSFGLADCLIQANSRQATAYDLNVAWQEQLLSQLNSSITLLKILNVFIKLSITILQTLNTPFQSYTLQGG